ncbi:MAG: metal-dependent hydrolase [Anaerolineae bacterium]|jgi:L-ascorbate metabolism protein UlaG (beta-lactamase superfamily)|nr:metal-dependent hydrolase [Anaerolineae bacterium]MBT7073400.1 metal-dependent hydrolase [Anaerolineae bacterium]MBT7783438.1 metal-dependent hydrolase [Anaerolineae bacterium]
MTKFTWYGHATHGVETDGHKLLIDPFFTGNPIASTSADAVDANFILISHGHGDHVGDTVAIAGRTGAKVISNFEIVNWLSTQGVEKVHPQHIGGGFTHPFGYLKLTQALHGSALPDGSYGGNPAGFLLTTNDGKKIYMAQDTGLFGDMQLIGDEGIDLAVLPIGDNFTMGPDDALRAVKLLRPKVVIPIHYNTWELIAQNPISWADKVQAETEAKVVVLAAGESFEF